MAEQELAELVKRYRKAAGLTQEAVAARLSDVLGERVQQSMVSDNERGARWSNPDLPGAYVRALDIPDGEMRSATGYPAAAPRRGRATATLAEVIDADPTLTNAAKKHLIQQYALLQLASIQERGEEGHGRSAAR